MESVDQFGAEVNLFPYGYPVVPGIFVEKIILSFSELPWHDHVICK